MIIKETKKTEEMKIQRSLLALRILESGEYI